jgi:fatty-acyl-CoA synthase
MKGLMMDYQLSIPTILRRAESLFSHKEIISLLPDKRIHRYTYKDLSLRVKKLASALVKLGIAEGDRVATLSWNHYQHLEAYFAVPSIGAVVHPLNIRLSPDDLAYIVNHAEDKVIIVDQVLLPLFEKFKPYIDVSKVIVIPQANELVPDHYLNYEELLDSGDATGFKPYEDDEYAAAFMCYTSGTTGKPKGTLYSHRSVVLHALSFMLSCADVGINEKDIVLPVVPMFHACAWGIPYSCTFAGAAQVFPGPYPDARHLIHLFESEKVTLTAAVPTVMLNLLNTLDSDVVNHQLYLRLMLLGGSAMPRHLVKAFDERYGIRVLHSWGMTEMSPAGATSIMTSKLMNESKERQYDYATKQGIPVPFVEIRGRTDGGELIPHDGKATGELEVRGPWIISSYYKDKGADRFTADGWFKTGDIVTISPDGFIDIKDRSKDVIKSGGEWISSLALENALMGHPAVLEAAVIAVPDERWMERPFAYVVLREEKSVTAEELTGFLSEKFAKFWLPDQYEFIDAIPKTSVGKFLKSALRERHVTVSKNEAK